MIDLSRWNLTIPAGAKVISTKELNAGYTDDFFKRAGEDVQFISPSKGEGIKSTKNSTYPRAELRETLANGDDKEANWKVSSAPLHSLEATLSVDELPASGKAIIGQIHGETDHPPLKIQITGDTIYAQLRRELDGEEDKPVLLKGYKLGTKFTYRFEVTKDGKAKFFINGKQVVNDDLPADGYQFDMESYKNDTWYFKAGMYSQEKVGGVGKGQSTFSALEAYHGAVKAVSGDDTTPKPQTPSTPTTTTPPVSSQPVPTPEPVKDTPKPAEPAKPTLADRIKAVADTNGAGKLATKSAKDQLNKLGDEIDALPDGAEQTALYAQLKSTIHGLK